MTAMPNSQAEADHTAAVSPPSRTVVCLVAVLTSVLTSAGALLAYHLTRPAPVRFATLNVAQLFAERQEELMKLAAQGTGEGGTQKAVDLARTFGKQLEAEALALPETCRCVVLVRGAVVAGADLPDYTDLVRERLRQR
jgi:hypothetical protein